MLRMAMGAATALLIAAAAPAQAAKVEQRSGSGGSIELHVVGDAGANDISVRGEEFDAGGSPAPDYGYVYVRDAGPTPLELGPGLCHPTADPHEVVCEDYDDTATTPRPSAARLVVELGAGADSYSDTLDGYGRAPLPDVAGGPGDDTIDFSFVGGDSDGGDGKDVITTRASFGTHRGGPGADTIVGSDGPEIVDGGPGADTLRAGGGPDQLTSRDDSRDNVDCGAGNDTAEADFRDALAGCEVADVSANPDADGDGARIPGDCNDADPAVRPGAREVPGNGKDDDCRGGDAPAVDGDRDGSATPADCDDRNRAIHPGAADLAGNGIDEDCAGGDALLPPSLLRASLSSSFAVFRRYTKVTLLTVRNFEPGIAVRVRCRGGGCPFRRKAAQPKRGRVALARLFAHARLRTGAIVQVRISKPGTIGRVVRIRIRSRKLPRRAPLCLAPGAAKPDSCDA
jgi:hypothetical protein